MFHGEGSEAPGILAGDFVVQLKIKKHKEFKREGADLYYNKTISLIEALTGFTFTIAFLDKS